MLVRSYRTVSPLPVPNFQQEDEPSAVCFLWHFPASHLDWPLASIMPYGAPTFLNAAPLNRSPRMQHCGHPANSPSATSVAPSLLTRRYRGDCSGSSEGAALTWVRAEVPRVRWRPLIEYSFDKSCQTIGPNDSRLGLSDLGDGPPADVDHALGK